MKISRPEQRVLHVLALCGRSFHEQGHGPKVIYVVICVTRKGMALSNCNLTVSSRLRKMRLTAPQFGSPIVSLCVPNSTIRGDDILICLARASRLHRDPMRSVHDIPLTQSQGT